MDPVQLERYYIEFERIIQVNRMCQGNILVDHIQRFDRSPRSSAATGTWLIYEFCRHVHEIRCSLLTHVLLVVVLNQEVWSASQSISRNNMIFALGGIHMGMQ